MHDGRRYGYFIAFQIAAFLLMLGETGRWAYSQAANRVAQIPGIDPGPCKPGPEDRPWLNPNQAPGCRALEVIAGMTLEEKLAELGGITGRSSNKRLGLVAGDGSDGPNGIATMGSGPPRPRGQNVTAFANADVSTPEHQAFARKVAEEGAVLLKNEGGVLPIKTRCIFCIR
jgi:hypothetical protein